MTHGHFGLVPLGIRPTEIHDSGSQLIHQMDRSRGCWKNHDEKSVLFILEEDYVLIRTFRSYCVRQRGLVFQYYGH